MKTWKPWEICKRDPLDLPEIKGPPCKWCKHWRPQVKFMELDTGMIFDGVVCCHSMEQVQDFSCFREKAVETKRE